MRFILKNVINIGTEKLFRSAIAGNRFVLLVLKTSALLWRVPMGVFEFRRGNIEESLRYLGDTKLHVNASRLCLRRAREITNILSGGLPLVDDEATQRAPFNQRVLFACHSCGSFHRNGYAVRTAQIGRALEKAGVEVHFSTRLGYPWDLFDTEIDTHVGFSVFEGAIYQHHYDEDKRISGPELEYIEAYSGKLYEDAKKLGVSVIHAHSSYVNGLAAASAAKRLRVLSIYEVRGLWYLTRALNEPGYEHTSHFLYSEAMELAACARVDRVVCLSHTMKAWLTERGVRAEKISVVPNCFESNRLGKPRPEQKTSEVFQIVFLGSVTVYEGLDDLIRAIAILRENGQEVRVSIAGDGPFLANLKKLVKSLSLEESVHFLGYLDQEGVDAVYDSADLVVVVRKDSQLTRLVTPLKLVESLARGKPTLITNLPPLTEVLGNDSSRDIFVVPSSAPAVLCDKIEELIQCRGSAGDVMSELRNEVIARFSWAGAACVYNAAYQGR